MKTTSTFQQYPPHDRIPNFSGAQDAATRLADTREWEKANRIKINPDSPQRPIRQQALAAGKTLYMAVPRLRDKRCFIRLDPERIDDSARASTIGGASEFGEQIGPNAVEPIDLIVAGSVAVTETGVRIGKGEGYSDLEYAILREFSLVDSATIVATTVHDSQILEEPIAIESHDVPIDIITTPTRLFRSETLHEKPSGIQWNLITSEQVEAIPVLADLHP